MRDRLTKEKLLVFLEHLGRSAKTEGRCYLTGGTSAVLLGWRETTIDVDLKFAPEPAGVFDAIPTLKKELRINVELASPDDFIPVPEGWENQSPSVGRFGKLDVFHFDFVAQALSKLARGHERDLNDVREMLKRGLVDESRIRAAFDEIRPKLKRYPALDEESFAEMVESFFKENQDV